MPIQYGYHHRGYLPHVKVAGAAYFVTFRLADSLPRELVLRLVKQRDDLLCRAADASNAEADFRAAAFAVYAAEIDSTLDQHGGAAWMRNLSVADLVANSLRHFELQRYHLHAWCVMPNHVHAVVRPLHEHTLDEILRAWKSYTARFANQLLGRSGPFWQRESSDHWIRGETELAQCVRYTEENPVKAGLCREASKWPWSSAGVRCAKETEQA